MNARKMKAKFCLVTIDETQNWPEEVVARAGKVYGVYLFDKARPSNPTGLFPKYELHAIGAYPQKEVLQAKEKASRVQTEISAMFYDGIMFADCRAIDLLPANHFHFFEDRYAANDEEWERILDELYEVAKEKPLLTLPRQMDGASLLAFKTN
jgi:hypothetical protein